MLKSSGYFVSPSVISWMRSAAQAGIDFVFRLPLAAMKRCPVARELTHHRLLRHALARDLRGVELGDELLDERLRILPCLLRVNLVEQRVVLDLAIANRLRDRRVVDLRVSVTAEADEIDHDVRAKLVAELHRHAAHAHHGVGIFAVHVEDGNRQALGQVRREAAGIGFVRIGGEADQIVNDNVNCSADVIAAQGREVQTLGGDSLPRESGIAVHDDGHDLQLAVVADARLLGARASHRHRVHGFEVAGIRHQVDAYLVAVGGGEQSGRADVVLHVAAAQHAAGIDVFEAGEDLRRRAVHHIDDDVQASAMAHRQHRLLGSLLGSGIENLVEQRDQRGVAFQRVALGSDVARMDGLSRRRRRAPADRAHARGRPARASCASIFSWIHWRRSVSAMCMNSTPMEPA